MPIPIQSVVGFLRLSVNEMEAAEILEQVRRKGRYLTPAESSYLLRREISRTITEHEDSTMRMCWVDFCRSSNLDQYSSMTEVDVFEKWWAWVPDHFKQQEQAETPWG